MQNKSMILYFMRTTIRENKAGFIAKDMRKVIMNVDGN